MSIMRENTETIDRYVTTGHAGVSLGKVIMVKIFTDFAQANCHVTFIQVYL